MIAPLILATKLVVDANACVALERQQIQDAQALFSLGKKATPVHLSAWGATLAAWQQEAPERLSVVLFEGREAKERFTLRPLRAMAFSNVFQLAFAGPDAQVIVVGGPPFFVFVNREPIAVFTDPLHKAVPTPEAIFLFPLEGGLTRVFQRNELLVKADLSLSSLRTIRQLEATFPEPITSRQKAEELFRRRLQASLTGVARQDDKLWLLESLGSTVWLADGDGNPEREVVLELRGAAPAVQAREEHAAFLQREKERLEGELRHKHYGDATKPPPAKLQVEVSPVRRLFERVLARGNDLVLAFNAAEVGVAGVLLLDAKGKSATCLAFPQELAGALPAAATTDALWFTDPPRYLLWDPAAATDRAGGK